MTKITIALITLIMSAGILSSEPNVPDLISLDVIEMVQPEIPYEFNKYKKSGEVKVLFEINQNGIPENIRLESATYPMYGLKVKEALRKWKFAPPEQEGITYRLPVKIY